MHSHQLFFICDLAEKSPPLPAPLGGKHIHYAAGVTKHFYHIMVLYGYVQKNGQVVRKDIDFVVQVQESESRSKFLKGFSICRLAVVSLVAHFVLRLCSRYISGRYDLRCEVFCLCSPSYFVGDCFLRKTSRSTSSKHNLHMSRLCLWWEVIHYYGLVVGWGRGYFLLCEIFSLSFFFLH